MIMRFLKKIPAGMMVVPMLLGAIINTFLPEVTNIGSFTTAVFTSAGANTAIGIQLFCLGTTLRVRDMGGVVKRGGVLLISKFVIGAAIGIVVGKVFGPTGVLGLSSLAIISAVTNSNGSIYLALMNSYGDTVDQAAMPLLAINDGPMLTMIAMGIGGLADIPFMALVAAIGPILVGMILGNIDKDLSDFLAPAGTILLPFVGFCLGAGMNLTNIAKGGAQGILLGLVTCLIGGAFIVLCDRFISRRPGYAGWAVATTAGNAVAVPAVIAEADPSWAQWADVATSQVAASAILTAILVPIITSWWAKKFGCPKFPKDEAQKALFEKHRFPLHIFVEERKEYYIMLNGMIVEPVDNVVVAIEPVKKGETVTYMCAGEEKRLTAAEDITIYHKLAACDIAKGQPIVKYGEHIGLAARDIKAGEHVHCHNLEEHRENLDSKG